MERHIVGRIVDPVDRFELEGLVDSRIEIESLARRAIGIDPFDKLVALLIGSRRLCGFTSPDNFLVLGRGRTAVGIEGHGVGNLPDPTTGLCRERLGFGLIDKVSTCLVAANDNTVTSLLRSAVVVHNLPGALRGFLENLAAGQVSGKIGVRKGAAV